MQVRFYALATLSLDKLCPKGAVGKFSNKDPKASSTHCCHLFCSQYLGEGQTQKESVSSWPNSPENLSLEEPGEYHSMITALMFQGSELVY